VTIGEGFCLEESCIRLTLRIGYIARMDISYMHIQQQASIE
jgi:hypothetical protein